MEKKIDEIILFEASNKVQKIDFETKNKIKEIKQNNKVKINEFINEKKNNIDDKIKRDIELKNEEISRKIVSMEEEIKYNIISSIFDGVYNNIARLSERELFDFIVYLLNKEGLSLKQTLNVSSKHFDKFENITKYSNDSIELVIIKDINISFNGFMIVTNKVDYIFDFKDIVDKFKTVKQLDIYKEFFDHE
ncbi:hypothetical protein [Haploplasma axanthum]|nr:hypothetical protein [Haploplasma axanthum]